MAITKKQFKEGKFAGRDMYNVIFRFLAENSESAYKAIEIGESVGLKGNHVNVVLNSLKKKMLVMHKSPYWQITKEGLKIWLAK